MKRLLHFLLIACIGLYLILAACDEENTTIKRTVMAIENTQSGEVLDVGMDREEIEQTLGSVEKTTEFEAVEDDTVSVTYFENTSNQLKVQYENNKAILISVGGRSNQKDQDSSAWFINGVSLGSTKEEVLEAFAASTLEDVLSSSEETGNLTTVITYYYDEEGAITRNADDANYTVAFVFKNDSVIVFSVSFVP